MASGPRPPPRTFTQADCDSSLKPRAALGFHSLHRLATTQRAKDIWKFSEEMRCNFVRASRVHLIWRMSTTWEPHAIDWYTKLRLSRCLPNILSILNLSAASIWLLWAFEKKSRTACSHPDGACGLTQKG